jgi:hypothetical protein
MMLLRNTYRSPSTYRNDRTTTSYGVFDSRTILISNEEIDRRFTNDDTSQMYPAGGMDQYEHLLSYIDQLPAEMDRIVIRDYHLRGLTQPDIADHLNISQGGVSIRLAKAYRRLRYIMTRPSQEAVYHSCKMAGLPLHQMMMVWGVVFTTSQSVAGQAVANALGIKLSQCKYRYLWVKACKQLFQITDDPTIEFVRDLYDHNIMLLFDFVTPMHIDF